MSERTWELMGNLTSLVLGGVIVGLGVLAWLHDAKNFEGLIVVFGMLVGARGGILVMGH